MNKRDIDDQLKDLDFAMDDEIDACNERQGYRVAPACQWTQSTQSS
jgi:hypothetical protein